MKFFNSVFGVGAKKHYFLKLYEIYKEYNNGLYVYVKPNFQELLCRWQYSIELIFEYNPTKYSCSDKFILFDLKIPQKKVLQVLLSS